MSAVLFDSSFYIAALRSTGAAVLALRRFPQGGPLWLSAVVLEELYAGADVRSRRAIERLERDFEKAGRILVPNLGDWTHAGRILAKLAARYDYEQVGKGRLTNDALIAATAGRMGITVITANARDFAKLAEFRLFHWQLFDPRHEDG